jgi:hypothetical protein
VLLEVCVELELAARVGKTIPLERRIEVNMIVAKEIFEDFIFSPLCRFA